MPPSESSPMAGQSEVRVRRNVIRLQSRFGAWRLFIVMDPGQARSGNRRVGLGVDKPSGASTNLDFDDSLMTAMGRDGAQGLLSMRQAGARTAAQNQESCVVFGMPKEAIAIGAAEVIIPLDDMAAFILE